MRYQMHHRIANQRPNSETKHQVDEVVVGGFVTQVDNQQATQRDDGDDNYGNCPVAVHYMPSSHAYIQTISLKTFLNLLFCIH